MYFYLVLAICFFFASLPVGSKPGLSGSVEESHEMPNKSAADTSPSLGKDDVIKAAGQVGITATDESEPMRIAWDNWHKHLAEVVYSRFDLQAGETFKDSPPLGVKVRYLVTKDGQIEGLKILEKSADVRFDALACQVIMWLSHKPALLKFPDGSKRQSVEKFATFTQNLGEEGYQYTTGDKETVGDKN